MDIEKKTQGEWEGGEVCVITGFVNFKHSDGREYEGEWKNGKPHGKGTYKFPNGSKYTGEWKEGVLDGRGIYTEPSGFIDAGQFKGGTLWKGTHFFENGDKFVGEWKMGEPWNIEYFDKKGGLIGEIYREGEFPSNNDLKVYDRNGEIIDYSL